MISDFYGRVVAIDQRGYGDSDKPSSVSSYDMDHLIEDIRQLIGALGVYTLCVRACVRACECVSECVCVCVCE